MEWRRDTDEDFDIVVRDRVVNWHTDFLATVFEGSVSALRTHAGYNRGAG
jgi:hypothetical protein